MQYEWIADIFDLLATGWRVGPCGTCGRDVVTDGSAILDAEPTSEGDIVIHPRYRHKAVATTVVPEDVAGRIPLWRSHFDTCTRQPIVQPTVDGIRGHLVLTPAQDALARQLAERSEREFRERLAAMTPEQVEQWLGLGGAS